ncbi:MAG TPA: hypothetical protein VFZ97_06710 [Acidimicrobiales bacterium]
MEKKRAGPSTHIRPWIWILMSGSAAAIATVGFLCVVVLPFLRDAASPGQVILGVLGMAYFGSLSTACLSTHLRADGDRIGWRDPFGSCHAAWEDIASIDAVLIRSRLFWITPPRFRYTGLLIRLRDGSEMVTVAASMLTPHQRHKLYRHLQDRADSDRFRLQFREEELTASLTNADRSLVSELPCERIVRYSGPVVRIFRRIAPRATST